MRPIFAGLRNTGTYLLREYLREADDCAARVGCKLCAAAAASYRRELIRRDVSPLPPAAARSKPAAGVR